MAKEMPFDDDVMTLIMGLGGPEEPGQHGRTSAPMPGKDAVDVITEIRDLCEEFLAKAGKGPEEGDKEEKGGEEPSDETEEEK